MKEVSEGLSVEELMKPRVRIIAPWPGMEDDEYEVGQIVSGGEDQLNTRMIEKHPHLFKLLEWYEDRQENEMPEYVKLVMNKRVQYIHKIEQWTGENYKGQPLYEYLNKVGSLTTGCVSELEPATHAEYLQYTDKLNV